MFTVALVADHLASAFLTQTGSAVPSRVHLINEVTQSLKRAQSCRQAYLISGDVSLLAAYRAASADVDAAMDRVVNQDHQVNNRLMHAEELRDLVHSKLTEIGKSLETAHPAKDQALASATPGLDSGITRIQRLLDGIAQDESRNINGELEAGRARTAFHRDLVIALGVINVLFLAGVAFCATQIRKLHALITMCAWSKRVQYEDKWIPLEEYLKKRFGIRISHGISQEEFAKWTGEEMADALKAEEPETAAASTTTPPKAAA